MRSMKWLRTALPGLVLLVQSALPSAAQEPNSETYSRSGRGTRWLEGPEVSIKVLVEAANLGSAEVELGEITLAAKSVSVMHRHGSIEIFYILSGTMDHVVNGASHVLEPGMIGIVRPEDSVVHRVVSEVPVKALVIWAPGGEAERLAGFFAQRPVEE